MAKKTEWVLVEAIDTFRMRYVVEVPVGDHDKAIDKVRFQQAKEFSQEHLDELIVSHRPISEKEALKLCVDENRYGESWSKNKKIEVFFKIGRAHV